MVTFLKKARISSLVIGIAYILVGGLFWRISAEFFKMFKQVFGPAAPLPTLTTILIAVHPFLWCAIILVGISIVLKDFLFPVAKKLPNWPFAVVLVIVVVTVPIGLFLPIIQGDVSLGT